MEGGWRGKYEWAGGGGCWWDDCFAAKATAGGVYIYTAGTKGRLSATTMGVNKEARPPTAAAIFLILLISLLQKQLKAEREIMEGGDTIVPVRKSFCLCK